MGSHFGKGMGIFVPGSVHSEVELDPVGPDILR